MTQACIECLATCRARQRVSPAVLAITIAASATIFAAPSVGAPSLEGHAEATVQATPDASPQTDQVTWADTASHSVAVEHPAIFASFARAGGSASFGVLHAQGRSNAFELTLARTTEGTSFVDGLTFHSPTYSGIAILTYELVFAGGGSAGAGGLVPSGSSELVAEAHYTFSSMIGGTLNLLGESELSIDASGNGTNSQKVNGIEAGLAGRHVVTAVIDLDQDETLQLLIDASSFGSGFTGNVFNAGGDVDVTLYWAGITGLTTPTGVPLLYDVTSDSGTDYRQSFALLVPEPSTTLLLVCGLAALFLVRSRSRIVRPSTPFGSQDAMRGVTLRRAVA